MKTDTLSSRQLEILQLEIAITKTKAAQKRADETLDALHDKLMGQEAEIRFQRLMVNLDRANIAAQPTARTEPRIHP